MSPFVFPSPVSPQGIVALPSLRRLPTHKILPERQISRIVRIVQGIYVTTSRFLPKSPSKQGRYLLSPSLLINLSRRPR
jgi:hypothetical protein